MIHRSKMLVLPACAVAALSLRLAAATWFVTDRRRRERLEPRHRGAAPCRRRRRTPPRARRWSGVPGRTSSRGPESPASRQLRSGIHPRMGLLYLPVRKRLLQAGPAGRAFP